MQLINILKIFPRSASIFHVVVVIEVVVVVVVVKMLVSVVGKATTLVSVTEVKIFILLL